jgi:hypothetical protein
MLPNIGLIVMLWCCWPATGRSSGVLRWWLAYTVACEHLWTPAGLPVAASLLSSAVLDMDALGGTGGRAFVLACVPEAAGGSGASHDRERGPNRGH